MTGFRNEAGHFVYKEDIIMYFNNYVYGNIRVEEGELRTGEDPKTSLVWKDLRGASVKDDDGNGFLLLFGKGQSLFLVTQQGFAYTGIFKELDENGNLVMENGTSYDPKRIVFIGEGKND